MVRIPVRVRGFNFLQSGRGHITLPVLWLQRAVLPVSAQSGREADRSHLSNAEILMYRHAYDGWNFNSGNYLFTTDTK